MNRLIKSEKDYEEALSSIEVLMDARPDTPEMDELELLTALVEIYEDRHYPMDPPGPMEAIKFRMDQMGLRQKDLIPFIGSKSKVSEVLNRKRSLTLAMMRALNKGLGISTEILLRESGAEFSESMPDMDWSRFPLVDMAKEWKIHPAIIAGRIRFEQNNYKLLSWHVGNKQVRKLFDPTCWEKAV